MLPIRVFLFTIFFTTPSLAFDVISEQEYKGNVDNSREFKNLQQRSQIASACICGFTSFECCGRKRALTKVSVAVESEYLLFKYIDIHF